MSTKKHILELFESNRGQTISGQNIAEQLNISRNAVWKAIKELEKDGYKIEAATNKGYCFSQENDILSLEGILPFLIEQEQSEKIIVYDSLDSTNRTAKEMAIGGALHGTVIIADSQTSGRGRYGRDFFSPPKTGIYLSFILRPNHIEFETPTLITAFTATAVCEAIEDVTGKKPQIKWVNDIYLEGKKICGILTEAVTDFESKTTQWAVVGIGINFSIQKQEFPEQISQTATSIYSNGKVNSTRNQLAAEIINNILYKAGPLTSKEIVDKYKSRLMMLGSDILVNENKETYKAIALDVDKIARLIVRKESGEVRTLEAGEISIRK